MRTLTWEEWIVVTLVFVGVQAICQPIGLWLGTRLGEWRWRR